MNFIKMKNQIELHFELYLSYRRGRWIKEMKKQILKNFHPSASHPFSRVSPLKGFVCAVFRVIYSQKDTLVFQKAQFCFPWDLWSWIMKQSKQGWLCGPSPCAHVGEGKSMDVWSWKCGLLRTDSARVHTCFAYSVLLKVNRLKVLSKSCPRGLGYAGRGEHLVSLNNKGFLLVVSLLSL